MAQLQLIQNGCQILANYMVWFGFPTWLIFSVLFSLRCAICILTVVLFICLDNNEERISLIYARVCLSLN